MRDGLILAVWGIVVACSVGVTAQHEEYFDFEHVTAGIRYAGDPSEENLKLWLNPRQ